MRRFRGSLGRSEFEEHPQHTGEPVRLDGKSLADPLPACVYTDQVSGGAGVLSLHPLPRDGNQRPRVARIRRVRGACKQQYGTGQDRGKPHGAILLSTILPCTILPSWMRM